ncbi:MAG: disulfide bond formation protein DsbB [Pseudomonas sp.]|nr:disulfide bond formation protein DsbB [Pseudomonas sp.]
MHLARSRSLFFLAFIACALVIAGVVYLEHSARLAPCPLCVVQRALVIAFGLISLAAFIQAPRKIGWRIYSLLILLCAVAGAASAGRQVWLQSVPVDDFTACVYSPDYYLDLISFFKVVAQVFDGEADCIEVTWTLFGMSLPEWSLLAFAGMIVFAAYQLLQRD